MKVDILLTIERGASLEEVKNFLAALAINHSVEILEGPKEISRECCYTNFSLTIEASNQHRLAQFVSWISSTSGLTTVAVG